MSPLPTMAQPPAPIPVGTSRRSESATPSLPGHIIVLAHYQQVAPGPDWFDRLVAELPTTSGILVLLSQRIDVSQILGSSGGPLVSEQGGTTNDGYGSPIDGHRDRLAHSLVEIDPIHSCE